MDKLRVLVVDDSRQIREFVSEYILKPNGYGVDLATDGVIGLQKILADKPDLVLLDYEMPELTGLEVLNKLRDQKLKVPVILMTSHGSEQIAVEVFRLGVQNYVIKPFEAQAMLKAIEDALTVARLRREKEALTHRVLQANQQLEQHIRELKGLYHIGKSITALTRPGKMLKRIVEAVLFMTRSEECTLALLDPQTGQVKEYLSERLADRNQRSRYATRLPKPSVEVNGFKEARTSESLLSVPLQVGKTVVGTLTINKRINGEFTEHDDRLLRMLADYAAIAIYNMRLMHQLHLTKEREKQQIRGVFERYVAPTVVEQVLARPEQVKLGGRRQDVSVLFADVRGFSTFSANTSPEIMVELLNRYIRVAADAVLAEQGTIDKFMGDAIMAFFNAPLPQADHPYRAVRAAWALCRAAEQLHRHLPAPYQLKFGVGVGVGEAVVGNIGTPEMMNFTAIGDAVNKVKRLQENALGGQILISQETYNFLYDRIRARCIGRLYLKGQNEPELVYEVLDIG